jgi:hypothetical protein
MINLEECLLDVASQVFITPSQINITKEKDYAWAILSDNWLRLMDSLYGLLVVIDVKDWRVILYIDVNPWRKSGSEFR